MGKKVLSELGVGVVALTPSLWRLVPEFGFLSWLGPSVLSSVSCSGNGFPRGGFNEASSQKLD